MYTRGQDCAKYDSYQFEKTVNQISYSNFVNPEENNEFMIKTKLQGILLLIDL